MNAAEPVILELEEVQPKPPASTALAVADNSPAGMMMAAMRQGASLAEVEKMLELQQRWEANEARKAYNEAMAAFKSEAIEIIKRKEVDFTNKAGNRTHYKHAELSDVIESVGPALSKHGFSWSWTLKQDKGWIEVTCTLKHRLGHSESVSLGAPPDDSGGKNTIQQIVSTKTYLERHTLKAICGVAEKGEDNDGAGTGTGKQATLEEIWVGKATLAQSVEEMIGISKDGTAAFNKARDKDGYRVFAAAVQKRGAELREQEARNA